MARTALRGPDTCDDNYATPPDESQEVKEASLNVQELYSAIMAIANRLLGRGL